MKFTQGSIELFSTFISHLDDISSWNGHESASLFNLKEKKTDTKDSRIRTHDPDSPVYYANHYTTEDLLDGTEII